MKKQESFEPFNVFIKNLPGTILRRNLRGSKRNPSTQTVYSVVLRVRPSASNYTILECGLISQKWTC